ncbi:anaerobic sulfite reductase subunit AsrB [Sporomusa acidovorans]|uniref:Anaerobic sulfite reductase subunit B n=1 Tax=Sporomusa acidovorans (strain ATCC 49682 / DSM 3132 / Mol) TaxID=1123286 RepID=A0ABZ3JA59_SPOA4|nr:anaerobic sulfite reductase subunit AsrB [Sporomusa acidovorans]OZC21755.1 anaerobic sulfite reductase subunit B [Sporomusa acidovorans DSM 3132]SDD58087.1 anaerobic sulfite reductase subunit B [Sporomusa acidovorans]
MLANEYLPFLTEIKEVIKHTDIEYTFRLTFAGDVKPGQFFEVSLPKYGEAPISVSGIGNGTVDLTIRRVGKVTNEIFEHFVGDKLFMRGPYGNGFDIGNYQGKELVVVAGGTGLSPVKGVIDYFAGHRDETKGMTLVAGFKTPRDILFLEDFDRWQQRLNVILTVDCAAEGSACRTGLVTQYIPQLKLNKIEEAAAIVVGPPLMMKFATQELLKRGFQEENMWISLERKMCCGIGKCGHCKIDDTYVCLDGPVFNYKKGCQLID